MRIRRKLVATTALAILLFALACRDGARSAGPRETPEEEALDDFEAHLVSSGSTAVVAKLTREAIRLDAGQVLKFGPVGSFEGDSGVVRRISLPDGRDAAVAFRDAER